MPNEHLTDATKHVIDGASIATAVGTMMQVLPAIAALFTIIWTTIRIYETKTIQKLLGKTKE
jgi:glycerol-3-phosphate acyltransferase PlsY